MVNGTWEEVIHWKSQMFKIQDYYHRMIRKERSYAWGKACIRREHQMCWGGGSSVHRRHSEDNFPSAQYTVLMIRALERAEKPFSWSSFLLNLKNHTELKSTDISSIGQLKFFRNITYRMVLLSSIWNIYQLLKFYERNTCLGEIIRALC